jgi:hypothetical protein
MLFRRTWPAALDRQGDFLQSVDYSGAPYPCIRDYTTGLPCSAANTSGCFRDGGVVAKDSQRGVLRAVFGRWMLGKVLTSAFTRASVLEWPLRRRGVTRRERGKASSRPTDIATAVPAQRRQVGGPSTTKVGSG